MPPALRLILSLEFIYDRRGIAQLLRCVYANANKDLVGSAVVGIDGGSSLLLEGNAGNMENETGKK